MTIITAGEWKLMHILLLKTNALHCKVMWDFVSFLKKSNWYVLYTVKILRGTISFGLHGKLPRNFCPHFSEEKLWPKEIRWYSVDYRVETVHMKFELCSFLLKHYMTPNHAASYSNQYYLSGGRSWRPGSSLESPTQVFPANLRVSDLTRSFMNFLSLVSQCHPHSTPLSFLFYGRKCSISSQFDSQTKAMFLKLGSSSEFPEKPGKQADTWAEKTIPWDWAHVSVFQ